MMFPESFESMPKVKILRQPMYDTVLLTKPSVGVTRRRTLGDNTGRYVLKSILKRPSMPGLGASIVTSAAIAYNLPSTSAQVTTTPSMAPAVLVGDSPSTSAQATTATSMLLSTLTPPATTPVRTTMMRRDFTPPVANVHVQNSTYVKKMLIQSKNPN